MLCKSDKPSIIVIVILILDNIFFTVFIDIACCVVCLVDSCGLLPLVAALLHA